LNWPALRGLIPPVLADELAQRSCDGPAVQLQRRSVRKLRHRAQTQDGDGFGIVGHGQQGRQPLRVEQGHPAHAETFGPGRQPQILDCTRHRRQVHLRKRAPAKNVRVALVAQRHHQQLRAFQNAFDLELQKFLGPLSEGLGGQRALFVDECVYACPEWFISDPDEAPRLHQADARRGVGGLQQARQHVLGYHGTGDEAAHVAPFGDHPVDSPSLLRTERVIGHLAIVWNARRGIGLSMTRLAIASGISRPVRLAAVFAAVAATVVCAAMWVGYRQQWSWLYDVDWSLLNAGHAIGVKHPTSVRFWEGVSFVLGPDLLRWIGVVATVAALVQRNVRAALVLFACAPLSGLVTTGAKDLANRPRPSTMLAAAPSTSFPSGHALETTAIFLALLSFVLPLLSRSMRRFAIAVSALGVLLVGIARIALNVHYPSDVLAGWSLGYLYFLLCLLVFRPPQVFPGHGTVT